MLLRIKNKRYRNNIWKWTLFPILGVLIILFAFSSWYSLVMVFLDDLKHDFDRFAFDTPERPVHEFPFPKKCRFELEAAPKGSYDVSIFYHIGMLGNWRNIVNDQFDTLERCGLGYIAKKLVISYRDDDSSNTAADSIALIEELLSQFRFSHKMSIMYIEASDIPYEWMIMQQMYNMCMQKNRKENTNAASIVYYFHNKGSSKYDLYWRPESNDLYFNILLWRKFMEFFIHERPTLCLRAILRHGAMTCGVHAQDWPSTHYSGNFWAASCDWIRRLNNTPSMEDYAFYIAAELWIGNRTVLTNKTEFLDLYSLGFGNEKVVLYNMSYLPENYEKILTTSTMWPTSQIPLWLDYLSGLGQTNTSETVVHKVA